MVIANLHIMCVALPPDETDTPLFINPDAILTFSVSGQFFKPVSRWYFQIIKALGGIEQKEFPVGCALEIRRETLDVYPVENILRSSVPEILGHGNILTRCVINVKRY